MVTPVRAVPGTIGDGLAVNKGTFLSVKGHRGKWRASPAWGICHLPLRHQQSWPSNSYHVPALWEIELAEAEE